MNALPSSIEASLIDAGFSGTELLILRKLLEEDAVTLRQLATRSGRSTGVLDLAMKKLLNKGIVTREVVNGTPKFILGSLDTIVRWMQTDLKQKREVLQRKYQDFESFIATLKVDKERPDMEYFDGEEGIKQAYVKLLVSGEELLMYVPVQYKDEEDPLRDFRVQYFRQRRSNEIFARVIAHDTPLGQRYQSRDPFEYRKTLLLKEHDCPIPFEKIISGDIVACIDHKNARACFIRFPHLASAERSMFDSFWRNAGPPKPGIMSTAEEPKKATVEWQTKLISGLREFFLSKRSVAVFVLTALLAAGLTYGLLLHNERLNFLRMRDTVTSIAATGALQIELNDLRQLRKKEDYLKSEWSKVIKTLQEIRAKNADIKYAYIFRKSDTAETGLEFVADAHSLNPFANVDDDPTNDVDMNGDGVIDGSPTGGDYVSWPGQTYPNPPAAAFESFGGLSASAFYEDQWGKVITGYAPIRNEEGKNEAILAIDIQANKLASLAAETFSPMIVFVLLFFIFTAIYFFIHFRFIARDIAKIVSPKFLISILVASILLAGAITAGLYLQHERMNFLRLQDRVKSIASTGAFQFDPVDLQELRTEEDWQKPQWAKVVNQLRQIREKNESIKFAYLMRKSVTNSAVIEFIADSHSLNPYANVDENPANDIDLNEDGRIDDADVLSPPGDIYNNAPSEILLVNSEPLTNADFYKDQWGKLLSGYAPIKDADGNTTALFAVDIRAETLQDITAKTFNPFSTFIFLFLSFIIINLIAYNYSSLWITLKAISTANIISTVSISAILAFAIIYSLFRYTYSSNHQRLQEKAVSIAATAVSDFDPADIDHLRKPSDSASIVYERVTRHLKNMRNRNEGIAYAYIIRPLTGDQWEFVADANFSIAPESGNDGVTNARPGQPFNVRWPNVDLTKAKDQVMAFDAYTDQWGTMITGWAPIRNAEGATIAVLGIDLAADELYRITTSWMTPILMWFALFVVLILMRVCISQYRQYWQRLQKADIRRKAITTVFVIVFFSGSIFWLYQYTLHLVTREVGERLMAIASTAATQFDAEDLEAIRIAGDMRKEEYQRVFKTLNEIRAKNKDIIYAYIHRPTLEKGIWEFVADADSNYFLPFEQDINTNGEVDPADENIIPGTAIDMAYVDPVANVFALKKTMYSFSNDQWGSFVSGSSPIYDGKQKPIAVVGLDIQINYINSLVWNRLISVFNR